MEMKKHTVVGTSLGIDENAKAVSRDPKQRDAVVDIPNSRDIKRRREEQGNDHD